MCRRNVSTKEKGRRERLERICRIRQYYDNDTSAVSTSVPKGVPVERPVLGSVPWVVASFQTMKQGQTTRPDRKTGQQHQAPGPPTSRHQHADHKRTHTPRGTTTRTARKLLLPVSRVRLERQRTGGTSAPLVHSLLLPPQPKLGRFLLSEAQISAVLPLFLYRRTHDGILTTPTGLQQSPSPPGKRLWN